VEAVTGTTYWDYHVPAHIFRPSGMTGSGFDTRRQCWLGLSLSRCGRRPPGCRRAARERQLAWTREFARASDVASALEAFLDADAIAAELLE